MEDAFTDLVVDLNDLADCYTKTDVIKECYDTEIIKEQALGVVTSWRNYQTEVAKFITVWHQPPSPTSSQLPQL